MSTPKKPRIRPKADPYRAPTEQPRDPPAHPEHDPSEPFMERDRGTERKAAERVIFQEDDCLR